MLTYTPLAWAWANYLYDVLRAAELQPAGDPTLFWKSPHAVLKDKKNNVQEQPELKRLRIIQEYTRQVISFRCNYSHATQNMEWTDVCPQGDVNDTVELSPRGQDAVKIIRKNGELTPSTKFVNPFFWSYMKQRERELNDAYDVLEGRSKKGLYVARDILLSECHGEEGMQELRKSVKAIITSAASLASTVPVYLTCDTPGSPRSADMGIAFDLANLNRTTNMSLREVQRDRLVYVHILRFLHHLRNLPLVVQLMGDGDIEAQLDLAKMFGIGGNAWKFRGKKTYSIPEWLQEFMENHATTLMSVLAENKFTTMPRYVDLLDVLVDVCKSLSTIRTRRHVIVCMYPYSDDIRLLFDRDCPFRALTNLQDVRNLILSPRQYLYTMYGLPTRVQHAKQVMRSLPNDMEWTHDWVTANIGKVDMSVSIFPRNMDCINACRKAIGLLKEQGWTDLKEQDLCVKACGDSVYSMQGTDDHERAISLITPDDDESRKMVCEHATQNTSWRVLCNTPNLVNRVIGETRQSHALSRKSYLNRLRTSSLVDDCAKEIDAKCVKENEIDVQCLTTSSFQKCQNVLRGSIREYLSRNMHTPFYAVLGRRLGVDIFTVPDDEFDALMRVQGHDVELLRVATEQFKTLSTFDDDTIRRLVIMNKDGAGTTRNIVDNVWRPLLSREPRIPLETLMHMRSVLIEHDDKWLDNEMTHLKKSRAPNDRWIGLIAFVNARHIFQCQPNEMEDFLTAFRNNADAARRENPNTTTTQVDLYETLWLFTNPNHPHFRTDKLNLAHTMVTHVEFMAMMYWLYSKVRRDSMSPNVQALREMIRSLLENNMLNCTPIVNPNTETIRLVRQIKAGTPVYIPISMVLYCEKILRRYTKDADSSNATPMGARIVDVLKRIHNTANFIYFRVDKRDKVAENVSIITHNLMCIDQNQLYERYGSDPMVLEDVEICSSMHCTWNKSNKMLLEELQAVEENQWDTELTRRLTNLQLNKNGH